LPKTSLALPGKNYGRKLTENRQEGPGFAQRADEIRQLRGRDRPFRSAALSRGLQARSGRAFREASGALRAEGWLWIEKRYPSIVERKKGIGGDEQVDEPKKGYYIGKF